MSALRDNELLIEREFNAPAPLVFDFGKAAITCFDGGDRRSSPRSSSIGS